LHAKARAALLIGSASGKIASQIGDSTLVLQCGTLAAAVQQAHRAAAPGDTVLLAPACASFDQFENFEQRGRIFKELVRALAEGAS
jgi:UDP-N-acetylmuramoylalanine--D-glutamate ligase